MHCYLDLYLSDNFQSIPSVQGLSDISQNMLRSRYDEILDMLYDKYLLNEIIQTYIWERGMLGLELWRELLEDFGTVSFKQFLDMYSLLFAKLQDPAVSLADKLHLLEHADNDILPLPFIQRLALFN